MNERNQDKESLIHNTSQAKDSSILQKKSPLVYLFKVATISISLWLAEFIAQYFWISKGIFDVSLVRSFALTGASLLSATLLSSAIFKWFPKTAKYWLVRRYLGVSGFIFILLHVFSVYYFYYNFDFLAAYPTFNPIENPIVFGTLAFTILIIMALTSSDWAVKKLTPKVWKLIHRFVYIAFWAAIFHFMLIQPSALNTLPGYLLILITLCALFGQLYWFLKIAYLKKFKSFGALVGFTIILLYVIMIFFVYQHFKP